MPTQAGTQSLGDWARPTARWILWTQNPRWVRVVRTTIRREFHFRGLEAALIEIPALAVWQTSLARFPASFITLEATPASFIEILNSVPYIVREFPDSHVSIVTSCDKDPMTWLDCELALREAGAITVIQNIWDSNRLVNGARCHMANIPASDLPLDQRIWAELPWSDLPTGRPMLRGNG